MSLKVPSMTIESENGILLSRILIGMRADAR